MQKRLILLAAGLALTLAVSAPPGTAAEFIYGTYLPPKHSAVRTLPPVFEALKRESKGALDWKVVSGGQLFGAKASLDGAGKGLADGSVLIVPYFRSSLPTAFTLVDMGVFGKDPVAILVAAAEAMLLDCAGCRQDYKKRNTIWLAGLNATHQKLMCAKPVIKMSDFKGLKVRTAGAGGRLARAMGSTAVGMTSSEIYTGLQRGQLDCVIGTPGWLLSHRLIEKVTHVYDYPLSVNRGLATLIMNLDRWKALSTENKRLMLKYSAHITAVVHINGYTADTKRAMAESAKQNVLWVKPSKKFEDFMANYRSKEKAVAIKQAKKRGVKNAEKIVNDHLAAVAKWEKRLAGKTFDAPALAELLWKEVYSKVDPEKL